MILFMPMSVITATMTSSDWRMISLQKSTPVLI